MLTRDPNIPRTWLKRQIDITNFDDAFRCLLLFAEAPESDLERLMTHTSEFVLDWEDLMSERQANDELCIYRTTEDADRWVVGTGFALTRVEDVAFSFRVLTLPIPSRQAPQENEVNAAE